MTDLLVHQKNAILDLINKERYLEALACVRVLAPLWRVNGYSYKTDELLRRIGRRYAA